MSMNIANDYTKRQTINYRTRSPIRAADWRDLADHQNLVWARLVSEWGGAVFEPPFIPNNGTTLTQTNSNGDRDLNELNINGVVERDISGGSVAIRIDVYAENTTIDCAFTNLESSTSLGSVNFTVGSARSAQSAITPSLSSVRDASGNPQLIEATIQAADSASDTTGNLFQIRVGEVHILSASNVPTS